MRYFHRNTFAKGLLAPDMQISHPYQRSFSFLSSFSLRTAFRCHCLRLSSALSPSETDGDLVAGGHSNSATSQCLRGSRGSLSRVSCGHDTKHAPLSSPPSVQHSAAQCPCPVLLKRPLAGPRGCLRLACKRSILLIESSALELGRDEARRCQRVHGEGFRSAPTFTVLVHATSILFCLCYAACRQMTSRSLGSQVLAFPGRGEVATVQKAARQLSRVTVAIA